MNSLKGKVALITGGAQGIGAATARLMAEAGAVSIIADLQDGAGRMVADSIRANGGKAEFIRLDVTSESEWNAAASAIRRNHGGLDILVNNAGIILRGMSSEMSLEDWKLVESVNIDGVFLGTKTCVPLMRERSARWPGGAAIVNMSSIMGLVGSGFSGAYSMSKGAVRIYTKSAALEFAQAGYRIRVNSVHPGFIATDMAAGARKFFVERGLAADEAAAQKMLVQRHPLGRLGEAEDIAKAIIFLASDDAAFITGSELVVDGGYTAQ
jgi:3(or 17)beta-hydroxysteroid dehydrogenase